MAYIQPNSEVYILRGIPFENNYEHSILFQDSDDQKNYFISKVKFITIEGVTSISHFQNYYYQRSEVDKIRVDAPIENFIDCNYMMFKNNSFENKWFYAFITGVKYINNRVTEVTYEIDVIQTWMFDYSLQDCFVEREHSETDEVGDNTVPENLEVGDYIYTEINANKFDDISDYTVVIAAPFEIGDPGLPTETAPPATSAPLPGFYNGILCGIHYNYYELNNVTNVNKVIQVLKKLKDTDKEQIVAIYMIPTIFCSSKVSVPESLTDIQFQENATLVGTIRNRGWLPKFNYSTPNVFGIKNNKLYTSPYNLIHVLSSDGTDGEFKYELFDKIIEEGNDLITFKFMCSISTPPEFLLTPLKYGINQIAIDSSLTSNINYNYSMPIKNIPMCAWETDGFKAWLAQATTGLVGGALGYGAMAALSASNPAITGVLAFSKMTFAASAFSSIAGLPKALISPQYAHGTQKVFPLMQVGNFGCVIYNAHIKPEYAAIIDDYFTKYGYATKRVKKPNLNSRPYWNYIETKNCNIDQSYNGVVKGLNIEDTRKLSDIYDHGITFWHPDVRGTLVTVDVGDYSKDNSPLVG